MEMKVRERGRITILELLENPEGSRRAASFREQQAQLVKDGAIYQIINLRHVSFITSVGTGVLSSAFTRCENSHGRLVFCEPNDRLKGIFDLMQLHRVIDIYETEAEAIASYGFDEDAGEGKG